MKKLLALFPAALLVVSLSACTDDGGEEPKSKSNEEVPAGVTTPEEDLEDLNVTNEDDIEATDPGEMTPTTSDFFNYDVPAGWKDVSEQDVAVTGPFGIIISSHQDPATGASITTLRMPSEQDLSGDEFMEYYTQANARDADSIEFLSPVDLDGDTGAKFVLTKKKDGKDYTVFQAAAYHDGSLYVLSTVSTDAAQAKGVFDASVASWKWSA